MVKREYIELIQRRLAGGEVTDDVRGKYHEDIIKNYVAIAFNSFLWDLVKISMATRDFSPLDVYTRGYIIAKGDVKTDTIRGQQYIEIPAPLPQLMGNNAIRFCGPAKEGSRGWLYRNPSAHDVMGELDVELVDQSTRYSPENNRIYLRFIDNLPDNILLKIITDYEGFPEDQDLPIPGGQDLFLFPNIIQLIKGGVEDTRNDNVINEEQKGGRKPYVPTQPRQ